MPLSLADSKTINDLADLLYAFLPASGNNTTSFPIAAHRAGISDYWALNGSKRPAIVDLLSRTYEHRRNRFCPLIIQVVQLGISYRSRKDPLTRNEIDRLKALLLYLEFSIPELNDPKFLDRLPTAPTKDSQPDRPISPATEPTPGKMMLTELRDELISISRLEPQPRGYGFEAFLNRLFGVYRMAPREPFRNRGEQIDGSFIHRHETFLLEAKWQSREIAAQSLWAFAGKVETKATWARGLFISECGFTEDGLFAFRQGKPTSIVCMDGFDLYLIIEHALSLEDVLDRKKRRAVETGEAFIPVRTLYPNL